MQNNVSYAGDAAEIALQVVPVVAIIHTEYLVLHSKELLHPHKDSDNGLLDDRNRLRWCVGHERNERLICSGPVVGLVTRTEKMRSASVKRIYKK